MSKETISNKQGISLVVLFMIGIAIIYIPGIIAGKESFIAVFVAMICSLPIVAVFVRLMNLFPGKDLFEIIYNIAGKYFGKILILLYIFYTLLLSSIVLRNLGDYIIDVGLLKTPLLIPLLFILFLSIWGAKEGIETLGRFAELFFKLLIPLIILTLTLLLDEVDINNILPLFSNGFNNFFLGTYRFIIFPFTELIIFTMAFKCFTIKKSPAKIFYPSVFISCGIGIVYVLMLILTIGETTSISTYFPSYIMVRRISIGTILQRLEILIVISYVLSGYIKAQICLLACTKGVAKLFGSNDYRFIVTPVALLILSTSLILFNNMIDMYIFFIEIWPFFAIIFQILLPILILIISEIKVKKSL